RLRAVLDATRGPERHVPAVGQGKDGIRIASALARVDGIELEIAGRRLRSTCAQGHGTTAATDTRRARLVRVSTEGDDRSVNRDVALLGRDRDAPAIAAVAADSRAFVDAAAVRFDPGDLDVPCARRGLIVGRVVGASDRDRLPRVHADASAAAAGAVP